MRARLVLTIAVAVSVIVILAIAIVRRERTVQRARTVLVDAGGLREGAAVLYQGVLVGTVTRLAFDTNGIVADLAFREAVPLRAADSAMVRTLGLLGDRAVHIVPGPHTAPLLPPNGVLPSRAPRPEIPPEELIKLLRIPPETVYREQLPQSSRP